MPRIKPNQVPLPPMDGKPSDACYYAKNTRIDDQSILSKIQMSIYFKKRFGYEPDQVFYGPPNGTLIYAGPILDSHGEPAEIPNDLLSINQLNLFDKELQ